MTGPQTEANATRRQIRNAAADPSGNEADTPIIRRQSAPFETVINQMLRLMLIARLQERIAGRYARIVQPESTHLGMPRIRQPSIGLLKTPYTGSARVVQEDSIIFMNAQVLENDAIEEPFFPSAGMQQGHGWAFLQLLRGCLQK